MGYIGQDEDHLKSPGTPSCDSLHTSNPMQSSEARLLPSRHLGKFGLGRNSRSPKTIPSARQLVREDGGVTAPRAGQGRPAGRWPRTNWRAPTKNF